MKTIFLERTDSTNSYLKAHHNELPDKTAVTALLQTAGRGRLGHSWEGNSDMLPMSVLLKNPSEPVNISARAGLAVCEALENALPEGFHAGVKWPNDVILNNRKVCGILCESVRFGDCLNVIIGIGINLSQSENYFSEAGIPHGGSLLSLTGVKPDRERLFESVAERVAERCGMSFSECFEEYKKRVLNLGREVRIIRGENVRNAFAEGISENGFLICRDENGAFEVNSGEVSVRGKEGYI
ncbi:MAG TPA: biotin--[acetyl-CoA-carboxylase] ligase [Ruminococcaceae bacterium]|nr:biotin--[acetyl-CoA-carboxylase] ligase [Oscillospiraceae bacterium]